MNIQCGRVGRRLLYQFQKGTNPRRVIIYLSEKGINVPRYELDYANGEHRSTRYLGISPSSRAHALVTDDGIALTDSGAIVEYMDERHPELPMIGTDVVSRARVRSLERLGSDLVARSQLWLRNRTGTFPAKEPSPSEAAADRTFRDILELLDVLEAEIGGSAFLAGDAPTVAGFTTFTIIQPARERFDLPFGNGHPRLDAWYGRFRSRPSAIY